MKHLLCILLILPAISFSQSIYEQKQGLPPSPGLKSMGINAMVSQIEEIEKSFLYNSSLENEGVSSLLPDSTHTYQFNGSNDSVLIDRTLFTYFSSGMIKIKSNYFWNDYLKKMLNNKYEYLYDRSGKLSSVTFNEWWFSHFNAYTSADGIFHPEVTNSFNYLIRYDYTYDRSGNKNSFIYNVYNDQTKYWHLWESNQYVYNSIGKMDSRACMSWIDGLNIFKESYSYDQRKNLTTVEKFNQMADLWLNTAKTKYDYTYDPAGKVTGLSSYYWSFNASQWKNVSKVDYTYNAKGMLESRIYAIIDTLRNELIPANKTDFRYNQMDKLNLREDFAWNRIVGQWELRKKQYYYYNPSLKANLATNADKSFRTSQMPFRIFPNPVKDILLIDNSGIENSSFKIYNSIGQCVKFNVLNEGLNTIHLDQLPKGIYIVTILLKDELKSCKLIVE